MIDDGHGDDDGDGDDDHHDDDEEEEEEDEHEHQHQHENRSLFDMVPDFVNVFFSLWIMEIGERDYD